MFGLIVNFRRGRHHQNPHQVIIKIANTAGEAKKFIGKKVVWISPGKQKKKIIGEISALHGRQGAVRAIFKEKGLPGQALGKRIEIKED